jgi:hypothetical protein
VTTEADTPGRARMTAATMATPAGSYTTPAVYEA